MSFSIGIVGLPNVGKSTLFTALTKKQVDVSNYPFCTIEPNVGVVAVPDERLNKLAELYNSAKVVPTTIEFVDIAGLVKGAAEGQGLGNKFLSRIREVDAIVEVVRDFKDENIIHVHGQINPEEDIKTIHLELILADLETVAKRLNNLEKQNKGSADKKLLKNIDILKQLKTILEQEKFANELAIADTDAYYIKELNLLTAKPMLYVYNINENDITDKRMADSGSEIRDSRPPRPLREAESGRGFAIRDLRICAKLEAELASLAEAEAKKYLDAIGLKLSGLDQLILQSYQLLNLITFFTAGPKEAHAWTVTKGTLAPQAAGKIHTDFEKGFVRAEIINWKDLINAGGEAPAKERGLVRTEGKNYLMQDGNVAYFLFNK